MNSFQIFDFQEREVRTAVIDGKPWFVGSDVAVILGYSNPHKAIRDHVDEEDKLTERFVPSGQARDMIIINESGLYALIFSSRLPKAKEFKRWVTSEVLPAIREKGKYELKEDPMKTLRLHYDVLEKHEEELKKVEYRLDDVEINQRLKWRDQMMILIRRGCEETGLPQSVFLGRKVYPELERRTGRSLSKTLKSRKSRMKKQGFTSKYIREFYKIDLIESEKKLRIVFEDILQNR